MTYILWKVLALKKAGKSLCCTASNKKITVLDGIKFELNDIISLHMKNDPEQRRFDSQGYYTLYL